MKLIVEEYNEGFNCESQKRIGRLKIAKKCLEIAKNADFPTDFKDVYDHLFEDDNYIRLFLKNEFNEIKGFVIACINYGYDQCKILHVHGIILSPDVQGLGASKMMLNYVIDKYKPDVVTAKTHNPRCFNAFINTGNGNCDYYPPCDEMPEYIREIIKTDKFICEVDDNMIFKNAYPDEKIQQSKKQDCIDEIFSKVGPYDAQALLVVINNEKIRKGKIKERKK